VADVLLVVTPYTLRYLIQFAIDSYVANATDHDGPPLWHGIAYLAGIVAMLIIQSFAHNHYMFMLGVIGGQCRAVLVSAIFEKSMRVMGRGNANAAGKESGINEKSSESTSGQNKGDEVWSSGQLTSFLSVDCARVGQTASAIHIVWTAPLSLTVAISLCK